MVFCLQHTAAAALGIETLSAVNAVLQLRHMVYPLLEPDLFPGLFLTGGRLCRDLDPVVPVVCQG